MKRFIPGVLLVCVTPTLFLQEDRAAEKKLVTVEVAILVSENGPIDTSKGWADLARRAPAMEEAGEILLDELIAISEEKSSATVELGFDAPRKSGYTTAGNGVNVPQFERSSTGTLLQMLPKVVQDSIEVRLTLAKSWVASSGNEEVPTTLVIAEMDSMLRLKRGETVGIRANVAGGATKSRDVVVLVTAEAH